MYKADEKVNFISDAVWILISEVLDIGFEIDKDDTESTIDVGVRLKKRRRPPTQYQKERFDNWKERTKESGYTRKDNEDRFIETEEELLGRYTPMSSPGEIELFLYQMKDFFVQIIGDMVNTGYHISYSDFVRMAEICVRKTFYHEYFHHYSDVQKRLFGFAKTKEIEEALAVAWSRMKVDEFCINDLKLHSVTSLFDAYKRKLYNYCIPGYKDWKNYSIPATFYEGICRYMMPSRSYDLLTKGVNLGLAILNELDITYQTSEAVQLKLHLR